MKDDSTSGVSGQTSSRRAPFVARDESALDEPQDEPVRAWTAEEAARWRRSQAAVPALLVVTIQAALCASTILLVAWGLGWRMVGVSMAWGCVAVVVPAALMGWGIRRPAAAAGLGLVRFFVWEWVKLGLSVALMVLAAVVVDGLHGLAWLAGVLVAVKAHWLAVWWLTRRHQVVELKTDLNTED